VNLRRLLHAITTAQVLACGFFETAANAADSTPPATWPTLHGDLQRSGFYPRFPKGPLKLAWRRELWRELTGPRAEVIVGGGLAFMGTATVWSQAGFSGSKDPDARFRHRVSPSRDLTVAATKQGDWPGPLVAFNLFFLILAVFSFDSASGQNIVGTDSTSTFTANPVMLTDTDVSESFVWRSPDFSKRPASPEAVRILGKLDAHVAEFLRGAPWMPFHHTLGISGYEANFAHPDEMFLELAFATPWVKPGTAAKLREFLAAQLRSGPAPYDESGFDFRSGRARESYDVPENLRRSGRARAAHALGIYSFWAYCRYCEDAAAAREHWPRVKARMKPLLETAYAFDPRRTNYTKSESEKLNGDLAGLLGLGRLARLVNDADAQRQAIARARQLLELRVNLDRLNPRIVEKSTDATKGLHNFKLARYCALVPEVAEALRRHTEGCAAAHLKAFRQERNGWHLAFGDRFIGGENYTNPLHLPRALFAGAVIIEQLPADQLAGFIDVPWCRGDLYFIEKCVLALWADAGRPWSKL